MPPKKKPDKKGKKGKKDKKGKKKGKETKVEEKPLTPEPTEKEILLTEELKQVTADLEAAKIKVEEQRKHNEWLQKEAQQVRIESHEYMTYMEKKTNRRQTMIITLSDHFRHQIQDISRKEQVMEAEFDEKRKALESLLLEKQSLLEKAQKELSEMEEYKNLQSEKLATIKELEHNIISLRKEHCTGIQQLKEDFLTQKQEYIHDSEYRIASLEQKANKGAMECLNAHTTRIKVENRELRAKLLELLYASRSLYEQQKQLEQQRRQLLQEQNYASDLKKLRDSRQQKAFKKLSKMTIKSTSTSEA